MYSVQHNLCVPFRHPARSVSHLLIWRPDENTQSLKLHGVTYTDAPWTIYCNGLGMSLIHDTLPGTPLEAEVDAKATYMMQ